MLHIAQTVARKQAVEEAKESSVPYRRYWTLVEKGRNDGYSDQQILAELERELERIKKDQRAGDPLFQKGVNNSKVSCVAAILKIIEELK